MSMAKAWLAPCFFFVLMLALYPTVEQFEYNPDEGINLMKAQLVSQGHELYSEVWNDQPPLFTHALAASFKLFGTTTATGRFLVLFLSCVLLGNIWRFSTLAGGTAAAAVSVLLIVLVPHYTKLSVSVMIGLPSLALAALSMAAVARWHRYRSYTWLVVSGTALGLSVMTKLFTGFIAPIFMVGLVAGEFGRRKGRVRLANLAPVGAWTAVFLLIVIVTGSLLLNPGELHQLYEPHTIMRHNLSGAQHNLLPKFQNSFLLLWSAAVGGALQLYRKQWLYIYPLAWMVAAIILLSYHAPVRYHHLLLVLIPAAVLSASLATEAIDWISRHANQVGRSVVRQLVGAGILSCLVAVAVQVEPKFRKFVTGQDVRRFSDDLSPAQQREIVREMKRHASPNEQIVTDRPMYAFRAGLSVPPELAVFSRKRLFSKALNQSDVIEIIERLEPREVLLARFHWVGVTEYLEEDYRMIEFGPKRQLLIRREP